MICSMCPTLRLSGIRAPGYGWQCLCRSIHCSHVLRCLACGLSRYDLECVGWLVDGRLVQESDTTDPFGSPVAPPFHSDM